MILKSKSKNITKVSKKGKIKKNSTLLISFTNSKFTQNVNSNTTSLNANKYFENIKNKKIKIEGNNINLNELIEKNKFLLGLIKNYEKEINKQGKFKTKNSQLLDKKNKNYEKLLKIENENRNQLQYISDLKFKLKKLKFDSIKYL